MRYRRHLLFGVLALALVASACGSPSPDGPPTPDTLPAATPAPDTGDPPDRVQVIVDYSPTVSDVGGLMYLLAHRNVEVIAISLPATGEAGCDLGIAVTLGILTMFEQEEIPVACDPTVPAHTRSWPSAFLEGHENLLSGLPTSSAAVSLELAPDLIARTAIEADAKVVIYAVAPLTNVARALEDYPKMADAVERIVVMGGAVSVPGNVEGTTTEWNLWIDVPAAAAVIASGVPVTLVPLDATNDVPIPDRYRDRLDDAAQSNAIVYLGGLVPQFPAVTSGFYYMWDELAAAVVAGESLMAIEQMPLHVVEGGADDGKTARGTGTDVTVVVGVASPEAFYQNFLSTLAGSG